MSGQVTEMNLPIISVPPMGTVGQMDAVPSPAPAESPSIVVGSPDGDWDPACISVYAESIVASGTYDAESPVCTFDVVFSVGIREGDCSKTYRVVKRIGIDKVKLACEAECSTPVSVVEDKAEARKAEAAATAKRFRILAGLE